jgi:competence protein ComEC
MERRPLLLLGIAAAAGAGLTQPLDGTVRLLLLAAAVSFIAWTAMLREPGRIRLLAVPALALGGISGSLHTVMHAAAPIRAHTTRVSCTVLDTARADAGMSAYTCASDGGPTFAIEGAGAAPPVGAHVLLRGRSEPFDSPRNPGEPDQRAIEAERGVEARLSSAHVLARLADAPPTLPIEIARIHAWALAQLRLRLAEPYASIVAGELWGEQGALPPELRAEFQETGTVHILVTAGLHLGVVALIVTALLRSLTVPRVTACCIAIAAIWAYAVFSGLHLPSTRAAVMITFALCAHAAGASARSWNAYGAALAALAVFWPQDIASASFALSFSCVGAILLLADELQHLLETFALPERVKEALVLTAATQMGTWPLTASIFLLVAPYAFLANLLVVPIVGITMMLAAAQLLLTPLAWLAQLAANANSWLLAWIVSAVHTIASLPHAVLYIKPPSLWAIVCYDAALVAAAWCWKRQGRTVALVALAIAIYLVVAPPAHRDGRLRITVLDVGQADAIVIQTPLDHTLLVDAGGRLERGTGTESSAEKAGERIAVPFLRRAGANRIDALILSHPHGDHVGAAAPILRDGFSVGELADSGQQYAGFAWRDAVLTARADHVPIVHPRAGMVWRTDDGVTLAFIGPSLPFIEGTNTINDNSIAFILQYKQFRMLFTGDAGVAAEQRFLNEGIDLRATVLKVGHHGSAYSSSSAFVAAVHPRYAIISVGRHNMFGHPAPSTIETLQGFGARIYRTDENGAVSVTTDGFTTSLSDMLH